MPTPRETILAALHARLQTLAATALRGDVLPERIPAAGLLTLRDGEPGEPEVTLSPLTCHYDHRAEIEAVVQRAARDTAFDSSAPVVARRWPTTARSAGFATGSRRRHRDRLTCRRRCSQPEGRRHHSGFALFSGRK